MPSSNLSSDTSYTDWSFLLFFSFPVGKCWYSTSPVCDLSFQFIIHQHYIFWDADSVVKWTQKIPSFIPFSEPFFSPHYCFRLHFIVLQCKLCTWTIWTLYYVCNILQFRIYLHNFCIVYLLLQILQKVLEMRKMWKLSLKHSERWNKQKLLILIAICLIG